MAGCSESAPIEVTLPLWERVPWIVRGRDGAQAFSALTMAAISTAIPPTSYNRRRRQQNLRRQRGCLSAERRQRYRQRRRQRRRAFNPRSRSRSRRWLIGRWSAGRRRGRA